MTHLARFECHGEENELFPKLLSWFIIPRQFDEIFVLNDVWQFFFQFLL